MVKPKVLIVGKLPPPYYGPAVATQIILNSELKHKFDLIHLKTTVNQSISDFGSFSFGKLLKNIRIYFRLISLLIKHKPDLCLIPISQSTPGFVKDSIFILLSSLFGAKVVLQLRGSNFQNWMAASTQLVRSYIRYCFRQSEGMIVLGEKLKDLFEGYYKKEQIFVVPNGCDLDIQPNKPQDDIIRLLYFANFHPAKGIKEVLEAIAILKAKGIGGFTLKAVGAWNNSVFEQECKQLVEEKQLPVEFRLPTSGDEKWNFFGESDIFLFTPNKPEGHPWVIVEALAAGLPIISTDQGAITESVLDGKNGFIVKSNSPQAIAKQIQLLIDDKNLREKFGAKSKQHYIENFTESNMVENLSKVFNHIISIKN